MYPPQSSPRTARRLALLAVSTVLPAFMACGVRSPLAHPSLEPFRHYEQPRDTAGVIEARFFGVSSLLFQDDSTVILGDPFVTRPGLLTVGFSYFFPVLSPDSARIANALTLLGVDSVDAVFTTHSHYDHAMDAPLFAKLGGAELVGSPSTRELGRGEGLPDSVLRVIGHDSAVSVGTFTLTFIRSRHSPPDRYPGIVDTLLDPPARVNAWKGDITYSVLIRHASGSLLVQAGAGYEHRALCDHRADVVYLGVGSLGKQPADSIERYWDEVVRATQARRVILVHWDDFFRTLDHPLRTLPYGGDDFTSSMLQILRLAAADSVDVQLPVPWQPTDPFAGLRPRDSGRAVTSRACEGAPPGQ